MINFTVGPVMSSQDILDMGAEQVPYFRTPEFSKVMLESEQLILEFADAPTNSRAVFLTGSGTAAMEAAVMNTLTPNDKALVVVGGSFGRRFSQLCTVHGIPHSDIEIPFGETLTADQLAEYEGQGYTALLVNIHETSMGLLYDASLLADFCKRNNLFFIMDAISAFLAEDLSMDQLGVDVFLTGSQKALACPPGVSILALSPTALKRIEEIDSGCMYLDLTDALVNGERGQTPFTPAVGILLQINARLRAIKANGGIATEVARTAALAQDFREKIKGLPFSQTSPAPSNAVTVLSPTTPGVSAYDIFTCLKDEYEIWVCPNGGELASKVFRVGHIGALTPADNDALVSALTDMQKRGLL